MKKVESIVDKLEQENLLNDIDALKLAQSKRIFTKASNLFIKDVQHFTPSTNNALEATNRVIKDENTFRKRLPLSRFKVLVFEIVEKWSKSYQRGLRVRGEGVNMSSTWQLD
jgi:hypothetical protein